MAVLTYQSPDDQILEHEFIVEVNIGTGLENDFRLPGDLSVASKHAVISRSEHYQVPVLIDFAAETSQTRVNGRGVVCLKILRHRDNILLGDAKLVFWEMRVRDVTPGSLLEKKTCLVCYDMLQPGDQAVECPRCLAPHHKECWFYLTTCSYYGCGYPVQETIRRSMAPWVRFEKLEEKSELVKENIICGARNERDLTPFKQGEYIAFCPDCETPFHTECWFGLQECQECGYNVSQLMNAVFVPNACEVQGLQEAVVCRIH